MENKSGQSARPWPLVSVIIPAYNAEKFVLEAIQSVIDQHYEPIEILLIDDGSKDCTVDLVRREIPQVKILQQPNSGAAAARNTGLRNATGEFLCFLDADDGWYPGKLKAQVNYLLLHPEVGVVYHKWHVSNQGADGIYSHSPNMEIEFPGNTDSSCSGWIYSRLLLDCIVHTSTVMMRRTIASDIGYFETTLATGEDYDYWLRVSRRCEIHKLNATYSFYRISEGSLTSSPRSVNNEYNVLIRAIERWGISCQDGIDVSRDVVEKRLAKLAFDFGYTHFYQGSTKIARNAFLQTLGHDPLRWRALCYWAICHLRLLMRRP